MIIVFIILSLLIVLITVWILQYLKFEKHLKRYPGPPPLPIIGNAHQFHSEILASFLNFQKIYGQVFKTSVFFVPPVLLVADVKFAEFILTSTKTLDKADNYKYFTNWLGQGLLKSTGDHWKKQRKIITPAFHFKILEQFVDSFTSFSDILIEKFDNYVGKDCINIEHDVSLCTLDIICASAMGTNVKAQTDDSGYTQSVMEMCRIITERMGVPKKAIDILYYFSEDYKIEHKLVPQLQNYTNNIILSRKQQLKNTIDSMEEVSEMGIKRKLSLLDSMLRHKALKHDITNETIREEVDTFMFAGHDTTASAISFALYAIANHGDVQERIVDELRVIFSDNKDRKPTYQDLQEMKYLEMAIKETLRVYSPVPLFGRKMAEDIEYDGGIIPKDVTVYIFNMGIHNNPKYFPDPERFDPERFTLENHNKRPIFSYIPFSAGPRNCIGQKFAWMEMKAIISNVLRHFELLPSIPEKVPELIVRIVLKSSNGINIRVKKRNF